ncbi:type VII secretion target [Saccharopolyspora phatthalungensis]|uniref:type VII secretion target n=1 Tax=Saccharopolyspora phatthalungensis TaxID=664693 RepID=UPI001FE2AF73|nr:type VII secretion target [Saccharopolyspora phatthalungensis]
MDQPTGQCWQTGQRFADKAEHATAGALPLIKEMQKVLQEQADAFRAAARDYRATDDQNAQDLQRGIQ